MNEPADPELWRTFLKEWYAVYREVCRIEMNDPQLADCPPFTPLAWEQFEARHASLSGSPERFAFRMSSTFLSARRYQIPRPPLRFPKWQNTKFHEIE